MNFISQHRTAFLVESALLIILGLLAIALPFYASLSVELIVAWILFFGGLVQFYKSIQTIKNPGGITSLVVAFIYTIIGLLMLVYPVTGMLSLTLLVGIFFALEGITKAIVSFEIRPTENWGWLLVSGLLSLTMSGIILLGFPGTALWVIGLLVGINMIFFGFSIFAIAWNTPKA